MSDSDEPLGLVPLDEEWPEPATVLHSDREAAADIGAVYGMSQNAGDGVIKQQKEEEEQGGVYSLAFDPTEPKGPGITRSAEWDQGQVASPPSVATAVKEVASAPGVRAASVQPPAVSSEVVIKTEVDPLFGDEVKIAVPAPKVPQPVAESPPPVTNGSAAPLARLATDGDLKLHDPIVIPPPPDSSQSSPVVKKKKKKQAEPEPVEDKPSLDTPTTDVHMYRLSEAEENRIKLDEVPKSLFFEGVLTFPWQIPNIGQWIWLSLGFSICLLLLRLIYLVIESGSMYASVGAAAIGMASLLLVFFTLAKGCGCWSSTITYTAAGSKAVDWANEGWRENIIACLRIGYYFALALMMATPLLVLNVISIGTYLWLMGALFIFPVFLFSGMASLTFWNFLHGEVIKTMILKMHQYLLMFLLSAIIFFIAGVPAYFATQYGWLSLIAGPLCAAAWLIYGRLLGRMAYLLQQEPKRKKKKKKKKQSQGGAEESAVADQTAEDSETDEKGPREDARGPGGARPV
ncbi:MAG TPA: hypothetical protein PLN21_03160 [Gemmatales bacterium]|nr:hypothetical protein [Gemmatales bacterium]